MERLESGTKEMLNKAAKGEEDDNVFFTVAEDVAEYIKENPGVVAEGVMTALMFAGPIGWVGRGVGTAAILSAKFGAKALKRVSGKPTEILKKVFDNPSTELRRLFGSQKKLQYKNKQNPSRKDYVDYKTKTYKTQADAERALRSSKFKEPQKIVQDGDGFTVVPTAMNALSSGKTAATAFGLGAAGKAMLPSRNSNNDFQTKEAAEEQVAASEASAQEKYDKDDALSFSRSSTEDTGYEEWETPEFIKELQKEVGTTEEVMEGEPPRQSPLTESLSDMMTVPAEEDLNGWQEFLDLLGLGDDKDEEEDEDFIGSLDPESDYGLGGSKLDFNSGKGMLNPTKRYMK